MFFILSKIFWFLVNPYNLFFIFFSAGAILLFTRKARLGRRLLAAVLSVVLVISVLPVGEWVFMPLENRFPPVKQLPDKVDGIIALGGVVNQFVTRARGQVALGGAVERLTVFAELSRRYPQAKLVYTTGSGNLFRQDVKEADVVGPFFDLLGLNPKRVHFENESRNTYENAAFSKSIVTPKNGETWILITSAFHMPRAVGVFRKVGWPVVGFPVDYHSEGTISFGPGFVFLGGGFFSTGLHEWIGLLAYWAMDKTDTLFPSPNGVR